MSSADGERGGAPPIVAGLALVGSGATSQPKWPKWLISITT